MQVLWVRRDEHADPARKPRATQRLPTAKGEFVPLQEAFALDIPGQGEGLFVPFYVQNPKGGFRARAVLYVQQSSPPRMKVLRSFDACPEDCQSVNLGTEGAAPSEVMVYRFTTNGKRYTRRIPLTTRGR